MAPENADNIELFHLPDVSPELKPDELLNDDLKQRVTSAAPAHHKIAMKEPPSETYATPRNNHKE
jgi:hypothetical protein